MQVGEYSANSDEHRRRVSSMGKANACLPGGQLQPPLSYLPLLSSLAASFQVALRKISSRFNDLQHPACSELAKDQAVSFSINCYKADPDTANVSQHPLTRHQSDQSTVSGSLKQGRPTQSPASPRPPGGGA